jgi:hypothetical protein
MGSLPNFNDMVQSISFLRKAADFQVVSTTSFEYNFNEHRGGSFTNENIAQNVIAYNTTWELTRRWVDRSWGIYSYEYSPKGQPTLPEKIFIENSYSSMPQWCDHNQKLYWYGELILSQSDEWGRKSLENLEGMKAELEKTSSKEECLKMIVKLSNRAYYERKCAQLIENGLTEPELKKYFASKAQWKGEAIGLLVLVRTGLYPKSLFIELSICQSHWKFEKIAERCGINNYFTASLPRKQEYCQFLADMS